MAGGAASAGSDAAETDSSTARKAERFERIGLLPRKSPKAASAVGPDGPLTMYCVPRRGPDSRGPFLGKLAYRRHGAQRAERAPGNCDADEALLAVKSSSADLEIG